MTNRTGLGAGWRRDQSGAAALEFALVVPILLALIMGIFTGGKTFNDGIALGNAVREGARFGATTATGGSWATDTRDYTAGSYFGSNFPINQICVELVAHPGTVKAQFHGPDGDCVSTRPANPTSWATGECVVKVWGRVEAEIGTGFAGWTFFLDRRSVSRYEREPC